MKQFANIEEYTAYCTAYDESKGLSPADALFVDEDADSAEFTAQLIADGYDPDDLLADGHAYGCYGRTNNGWLYRDEIDPCILSTIDPALIRERSKKQ